MGKHVRRYAHAKTDAEIVAELEYDVDPRCEVWHPKVATGMPELPYAPQLCASPARMILACLECRSSILLCSSCYRAHLGSFQRRHYRDHHLRVTDLARL